MTTLPAARLPEKLGSVGPALPADRSRCATEDGTETARSGVDGEVVYRGPNVMMGYAETAARPGPRRRDRRRAADRRPRPARRRRLLCSSRAGSSGSARSSASGSTWTTWSDAASATARSRRSARRRPADRLSSRGRRRGRARGVRAELAERLSLHRSGIDVRGSRRAAAAAATARSTTGRWKGARGVTVFTLSPVRAARPGCCPELVALTERHRARCSRYARILAATGHRPGRAVRRGGRPAVAAGAAVQDARRSRASRTTRCSRC